MIEKAAVISTGDELTTRHTVDTNASFIADQLVAAGLDVTTIIVVGDYPERITWAWHAALRQADVVISTGGLGPTADDLTTETVAALAGRTLVMPQPVADRIRQMFDRVRGIVGAVVDVLVAGRARRREPREHPAHVAALTRERRVRARQREPRDRVVEARSRPRELVVALRALGGEPAGLVVGINRALVVIEVARGAFGVRVDVRERIRRGQLVAHLAVEGCVRARQRKARDTVQPDVVVAIDETARAVTARAVCSQLPIVDVGVAVHARRGRHREVQALVALRALGQLVAIDPGYEYGGAYRVLGRVYFKLPRFAGGGINKSIENLKKSLEYAPNISTTHLFLAESYMAKKDYQLAQQELNIILSTPAMPGLEPEFNADKEEARRLLPSVNKKLKE